MNKNGSAPRGAFGAQIHALQQHYIGKSAAPHAFRGMQVSISVIHNHLNVLITYITYNITNRNLLCYPKLFTMNS